MAPIPLMIMSDAPTSSTGLARITRELCQRIHADMNETFELATIGYGGTYSQKYPWKQYTLLRMDTNGEDRITPDLPGIWYDFAGERKGILLSILNPGWVSWLADPKKLPPSGLRAFLENAPFEKWIYAPIDAAGPDGKLPEKIREILGGFDRILFYTRWSASLYFAAHGVDELYLPHGIDTSVFYPRDAQEVRKNFVHTVSGRHSKPVPDDMRIIGIVATNTARKDWGLGLEVCADLLKRGVNIGVWAHTDYFQKYWDLVELANSLGLARRVIFTNGNLSDETMAIAYSGCDVTLAIGSGEGFGYPIAESLACGTGVVHGDYGGGVEMVPKIFLVDPAAYRIDGGPHCFRRPVFRDAEWAFRVQCVFTYKQPLSMLDGSYSWDNLWPRWKKWLEEGVNG